MSERPEDGAPPKRKVGVYDRPEKPAGGGMSGRNRLLLVLAIAVAVLVILLMVWNPAEGAAPRSAVPDATVSSSVLTIERRGVAEEELEVPLALGGT